MKVKEMINKLIIVLMLFGVGNFSIYAQKIDSVNIVYIPMTLKNEIIQTEESLRAFDSRVRKNVSVIDSMNLRKLNNFALFSFSNEIIKDTAEFDPIAVFDIFNNGEKRIILLDVYGLCLVNNSFYKTNIDFYLWFRRITNQKKGFGL